MSTDNTPPRVWFADGLLFVGRQHGQGYLPNPDVALAQMLALVTDEEHFVRTANVHRGRRPNLALVRAT